MKILGMPIHTGIIIKPGYMLHSLPGHDSVIENYNLPKWKKRVEGFYRWKI